MSPPQEPCDIPFGIRICAIIAVAILILGIMCFR